MSKTKNELLQELDTLKTFKGEVIEVLIEAKAEILKHREEIKSLKRMLNKRKTENKPKVKVKLKK